MAQFAPFERPTAIINLSLNSFALLVYKVPTSTPGGLAIPHLIIGVVTNATGNPIKSVVVPLPNGGDCASLAGRTAGTNNPPRYWIPVGCTGVVYFIRVTPREGAGGWGLDVQRNLIGAGLLTSIAIQGNLHIYVGSVLGLGFQTTRLADVIQKILFIPGQVRDPIRTIITQVFSSTQTLILWITESGKIIQTTPDSLAYTPPIDIKTAIPELAQDPSSRSLVVTSSAPLPKDLVNSVVTVAYRPLNATDPPAQPRAIFLAAAICSTFNNCLSCVAEAPCEYCYATSTCTNKGTCSSTSSARPDRCPKILVGPQTLSVSAPLVLVSDLNIVPPSPSRLVCNFTLEHPPGVTIWSKVIDATRVSKKYTCNSFNIDASVWNAINSITSYSGSLTLHVRATGPALGPIWAPRYPLPNIYNCIPRTVSCHHDGPVLCGWCLSTGRCTSANDTLCPTQDARLLDPSLSFLPGGPPRPSFVTPSTMSLDYQGNITMLFSNFPAFNKEYQMKCGKQSQKTTLATALADPQNPHFYESITCGLPTEIIPPSKTPQAVEFGVFAPEGFMPMPISKDWFTLNIFSCSAQKTCYDCLNPNYTCTWCNNDKTCVDSNSALASRPTCTNDQGTCPLIYSTTPSSSAIIAFESGISISISGKGLTQAADPSCHWELESGAYFTANATVTSDTAASCSSSGLRVPTGGDWMISFASDDAPLTPSLPFPIYNCSQFDSCSDCISKPWVQCQWCSTPGHSACYENGQSIPPGCANVLPSNSLSLCPRLVTIDPTGIFTEKPSINMVMTGTNFNFASPQTVSDNLRCEAKYYKFNDTSCGDLVTTSYTAATYRNSSSVSCESITISTSSNFALVRLNDMTTTHAYSTALNVTVTSCASYTSCPSCIAAGCVLCGSTCTILEMCPADSPDDIQTSCPTFGRVSPSFADLGATSPIFIYADGFIPVYEDPNEQAGLVDPGPGKRDDSLYFGKRRNTNGASHTQSYHRDSKLQKNKEDISSARDWIVGELNRMAWKIYPARYRHLLDMLASVEKALGLTPIEVLPTGIEQLIDARRNELSIEEVLQQIPATQSAMLSYSCVWDGIQTTTAVYMSRSLVVCFSPEAGTARNSSLVLYLNDIKYLDVPVQFEIISCSSPQDEENANIETECTEACVASPRCGWCPLSQTCTTSALCAPPVQIWQDECVTLELSSNSGPASGGTTVIGNISTPLPAFVDERNLTCVFGRTSSSPSTPARVLTRQNTTSSIVSISCTIPRSDAALASKNAITVPVKLSYNGNSVASGSEYSYANCKSSKACGECVARSFCGWCFATNQCTTSQECTKKDWKKSSCPPPILAIALGVSLGALFLALVIALIVYLIIRARKRRGLVIQMQEPDYDAVAWGTDCVALYLIPRHAYGALERALNRPNDCVMQLGLAFNCPPTEQDLLSKSLVYVACAHNMASEMIKTVILAEVNACQLENQLFRSNSVASKMYKFYSRIVGVKYLFHCIARVIRELEVLGRKAIRDAASNSHGADHGVDNISPPGSALNAANGVSLLNVSMELDATKQSADDDIDAETSRLQLKLICQKIISVICKKPLEHIPRALREIFVEIDRSVSQKFAGSTEAIYKGLGGLFFLRFVCPAITAPHVYGLLSDPPNSATQRQLILIAKVIQSIANMQAQGQKETYMAEMTGYINHSIPRIRKFYDNLREAANIQEGTASIYERTVVVPPEILHNGLAGTQTILVAERKKIKEWRDQSVMSDEKHETLVQLIDECMQESYKRPKKN